MHFGEPLDDERLAALLRPGGGIGTVITADTYGAGEADALLGRALAGVPRESSTRWSGAIGHDFYEGEREGAKGFPRFTDPRLRGPDALRATTCAWRPSAASSAAAWTRSTCCCCTTRTAPATRAERGVGRARGACATRGWRARIGVAPGPGQRLHARPDRLLRALRRPHRLGDGDPQPARAVARRAGAPRGRAPRRAADHARGRLRRAVPRRRARRATRSRSATTARFRPGRLGRARARAAGAHAADRRAPRADAAAARVRVEPRPRGRARAWRRR